MSECDKKEAWLVYDGECPICKNYAVLFRARQSILLHLVDAREESALIRDITRMRLNLDEGMVLKVNDTIYYGSDAMHALACLGTPSNLLNRINYYLFRSKTVATIIYPLGKAIRRWLLTILRIPNINNLKKSGEEKAHET